MNLNFPYNKSENKEAAYKSTLAYLESDEFKQQDIDCKLECLDDVIKAKGKGFLFQALFTDDEMQVDVDLSFFLKPFAGKIKEKLSLAFKQNI